MLSARVIALSTGDTTTGMLTCVISRGPPGDHIRYDVEIRNDSASSASLVLSHDDVAITTIVVPGGDRYNGQPILPVADTPIRVDVTCNGMTLSACEMPASSHLRVTERAEAVVREPKLGRITRMTRVHEPERRPRRASAVVPAVLALFTILIAVALAGGFVQAHPHVGDLGAPNMVLEGSAVDVPYRTSGLGLLRYSVASSQGTVIAQGPLTAPSGVLHISIPTLHHNEAYRVRLALSGPLGDASNEATIGASTAPLTRVVTTLPPAPLIRSFAVSTSVKNSVPTVNAFYDVIADRGALRLIDDRGIQYGATPLNRTGQSTFTLPANTNLGTLAIVLQAMRNGASAEARIALPPSNDSDTDALVSPPQNKTAAGGSPIAVPERAVGGTPITVRVLHHYPELHVVLLDEDARQLADVDVPPDASSVTLPHPNVAHTTRVIVEATYRVQNEADTFVRPVLLVPAGG